MRPVNLIPPEERRGASAPMRTGALPYLLIGVLVLALAGVTLLVLASNKVSDSKAEVARLQQEDAAAQARAEELAPFVQFQITQEERAQTIAGLADSRFDWERVMRELALILPSDIWLTNLTGTASSGVSVEGGASVSLRSGINGPALEMTGCGSSQKAVAGFVQALKEIDGVTRVGMPSSSLGETSGGASGGSAASGTCQTRSFIAQFQVVVAFDAAPVAPTAAEAEGEVAAAPEAEATSETSGE